MPDLNNRTKLESDLARELARLGSTQLRALLQELGNPPSLSNVSDTFWSRYTAGLTSALNTFLQKVYVQQAEQLAGQVSTAVDWTLVNKDAAEWAKKYTYDLVKELRDTTRTAVDAGLQILQKQLQDTISQGIEQSLTLADIRAQLEPTFGPVRAEMIATTEITRATDLGEAAAVDRLKERGVEMEPEWQTREDETVCPTCLGLDGVIGRLIDGVWMFKHKETGELYELGPAHPRCRCPKGWRVVN